MIYKENIPSAIGLVRESREVMQRFYEENSITFHVLSPTYSADITSRELREAMNDIDIRLSVCNNMFQASDATIERLAVRTGAVKLTQIIM